MHPLFRKSTITDIASLLPGLRRARFPETTEVTAKEVIQLKADIRYNCDLIIQYVYVQLRNVAMLPSGMDAILNQLLSDAYTVKKECGKVSVNFLRPKHRRILCGMKSAYEELRLAAILVCQQSEPTLIDSLTVAL